MSNLSSANQYIKLLEMYTNTQISGKYLNLNQIVYSSTLVGYDNQISFMRIFKRYVSYTPSDYRSMYSDKDKNI